LSDVESLLSIDALDDEAVESVLARADELARGAAPLRLGFVLALIFLSPSTRTRVGFAVAAARLGGTSVDLPELRFGVGMSAGESLADTIRTVSGMVDVAVVRGDIDDIDAITRATRCPVISGGLADHEHPTQALIDVAAMRAEWGSIADARVTLCGDLGMRSVRSLVKLLARMPPARLTLVAPDGRDEAVRQLPVSLASRATYCEPEEMPTTDILYLPGLPERRAGVELGPAERRRYAATASTVRSVSEHGVILSPLPVIDEVDPDIRLDPRVRMFELSDRGVYVRIAVLERVLRATSRRHRSDGDASRSPAALTVPGAWGARSRRDAPADSPATLVRPRQ
jgi:aspartate carbamoyltransferase catalytic subunit